MHFAENLCRRSLPFCRNRRSRFSIRLPLSADRKHLVCRHTAEPSALKCTDQFLRNKPRHASAKNHSPHGICKYRHGGHRSLFELLPLDERSRARLHSLTRDSDHAAQAGSQCGRRVGFGRIATPLLPMQLSGFDLRYQASAYYEDVLTIYVNVQRIGFKSLTFDIEFFHDETRLSKRRVKTACGRCRTNGTLESVPDDDLPVLKEWDGQGV